MARRSFPARRRGGRPANTLGELLVTPGRALDNLSLGVSCTSASTCVAVGDYISGTTNHTLVESS